MFVTSITVCLELLSLILLVFVCIVHSHTFVGYLNPNSLSKADNRIRELQDMKKAYVSAVTFRISCKMTHDRVKSV
jgi:hypothetical protein